MLSPKLTTIRQDTDKIGREAADRLISTIKKPKTASEDTSRWKRKKSFGEASWKIVKRIFIRSTLKSN